jgi:hypothetical protein
MARKTLLVLTGAVGIAAVATGAYIARHRRDGYTAVGTATAKPISSGTRYDDDLTQEFENVVKEESATHY